MKYPITPDYIKHAPDGIAALYTRLESWILRDICERFKRADKATETAIEHIRNLQRRGYSYQDIRDYVKTTNKLTDAQFDKLIKDAVDRNQRYYTDVLREERLVREVFESEDMAREINAIIEQAKGDLNNITGTMGFCMKTAGKVEFLPIAKAYQRVLTDAEMKVYTGAQSYNEAIRDAVKQLTDSGIRVVTWAKNGEVYHTDHIDVAARRAVMTGTTQIAGKYNEEIRKEVPTEYIEVTAHSGARDVDVVGRPWANHKNWQGKVYSTKDGDKYPNIYKVCGWGEVDGLEGANCRHLHFPFWDGISERTYTDEQLKNIDPEPMTFRGQKMRPYEASQRQRAIERQLRKIKREMLGYSAAGDASAYRDAAIKYRNLNALYTDFCEQTGLRPTERGNIAEFGPSDAKRALKSIG